MKKIKKIIKEDVNKNYDYKKDIKEIIKKKTQKDK